MNTRIARLKQINQDSQEAVKIIELLEEKINRALEIMNMCKPQVGMIAGEEIEAFMAEIKNQRFCSKQFNYERLPEGQ